MANCLGLQTTYTAPNVASRLQYSSTLPVPLLVVSPEIAPALFPTGEGLLGCTNESQGLTALVSVSN